MKRVGSKVLGLDIGLTNCGWCVMSVTPDGEDVVEAGVIRTRKAANKEAVYRSSDTHRRGKELAGLLKLLFERHRIVAVCAESLSFVRSSSAMADIGRAWGVLDTFCAIGGLPLVEASPQHIKQRLCSKRSASKKEVEDAVIARMHRGPWLEKLEDETAPYLREHAFDAVGAVLACRDSHVLNMARQMVTQ